MFGPLSATANRSVRKHEIEHLADVHRKRTTNPPRTLDTTVPDSAKYARMGNPKRLQQLYVRDLEIERQNRILQQRIGRISQTDRGSGPQSRRRHRQRSPIKSGRPASHHGAAAPGPHAGDPTAQAGASSADGGARVGAGATATAPRQRGASDVGPGAHGAQPPARQPAHRHGHAPHPSVPTPSMSISEAHLLRKIRRREVEEERRQEANEKFLDRLMAVKPVYNRERWRESMATHEHFRKLRQQQPTPKGMYENAKRGRRRPAPGGGSGGASSVQIVVESAADDFLDVHRQEVGDSSAGSDQDGGAPGGGNGREAQGQRMLSSLGRSGSGAGARARSLPDGVFGQVRCDERGRVSVLDSSGGALVGEEAGSGSDEEAEDGREGERWGVGPAVVATALALAEATAQASEAGDERAQWSAGQGGAASATGSRRRSRTGRLGSSRSAGAREYARLVRGKGSRGQFRHPSHLVTQGQNRAREARRLAEQRRWLRRHGRGRSDGHAGVHGAKFRAAGDDEGDLAAAAAAARRRLRRPQGPWLCGACDHLNSAAAANCLLCGALFMRSGLEGAEAGDRAPAPSEHVQPASEVGARGGASARVARRDGAQPGGGEGERGPGGEGGEGGGEGKRASRKGRASGPRAAAAPSAGVAEPVESDAAEAEAGSSGGAAAEANATREAAAAASGSPDSRDLPAVGRALERDSAVDPGRGADADADARLPSAAQEGVVAAPPGGSQAGGGATQPAERPAPGEAGAGGTAGFGTAAGGRRTEAGPAAVPPSAGVDGEGAGGGSGPGANAGAGGEAGSEVPAARSPAAPGAIGAGPARGGEDGGAPEADAVPPTAATVPHREAAGSAEQRGGSPAHAAPLLAPEEAPTAEAHAAAHTSAESPTAQAQAAPESPTAGAPIQVHAVAQATAEAPTAEALTAATPAAEGPAVAQTAAEAPAAKAPAAKEASPEATGVESPNAAEEPPSGVAPTGTGEAHQEGPACRPGSAAAPAKEAGDDQSESTNLSISDDEEDANAAT